MSPVEPEKTLQDQAFESALGEYLRRIDAGETVDREAFVQKHPQVADALRSYFATARVLEQMAGAKDDADARPTLTVDTARGIGADETVPPPRRGQLAGDGGAPGLPIPEKFGRYRIVRILGQGAMGIVYLAHDTELDRQVALKIPKFTGNDSPDLIERFYREARSAAALQHRNICGLFDIGENDGMRYITMAYIDGRPLSDFVNPAKPLVKRQVATTVRKIALALDIAHQRGVIHRDLKPANILIDRSREPVIMDFGLARQINKLEDVRITQSGALIGSPAYMSPEQVESDLPAIGKKSDIYSLGVILYELLTGKLPFQGSIAAVIGQIVTVEPKKPSLLRPDIDPELEAICLRMMAKKSDDRPASMQDVANLLTNYLKSTARGPDAEVAGGDVLPSPETVRPAAGTAASATRASQKGTRSKVTTRDDADALFRTARRCVNAHDYEQALKILAEIPDAHLTDEMRDLQSETQEIQDEVDFLIADIEDCSRRRQFDGVMPKVERLLKLKPGDARARQLYGTFSSARNRVAAPVTVKLGPLGKFRMPAWVATVAALLFGGAVVFGVVTFIFRDGEQTIRVEVDAALLAEKNVTVSFNGKDEIKIENIGETIHIKPGKREYTLKRGDTILKTRDFTVVRGANPVLHITQEDTDVAKAPAEKTRSIPEQPKVAIAPPKQSHDPPSPQPADDADNEPKLNFGEPTGKLVGARERWRLGGDEQTFGAVARFTLFSPDSKFLATVWGSKSPKIVEVASGKVAFETQMQSPASVIFTADSDFAIFGRRKDRKIASLDLQTGMKWDSSIELDPDFDDGQFTRDGRKLMMSDARERVALVDWPRGPVREIRLPNVPKSYRQAFTPDGKLLAMGNGSQAQVSVWNVERQEKLAEFRAHPAPSWLTNLIFSSDGRILVSTSHEGKVKFWEPETGKLTAEFNHPDWIEEAALSPDDRYLAVAMHIAGTWIWDVAAKSVVVKLPPHELNGSSVAFSPDGRMLATSSSRHNAKNKPKSLNPEGFAEVKLWDLQFGSSKVGDAPAVEVVEDDAQAPGQMWGLKGHTASIRDIAISPDSKWIVSCGNDDTVRIWSVTTGEQVHLIDNDFNAAAFSPDGKSLVLGQGRNNKAKSLKILGVGDWREIRRFKHAGGVTRDIAFTPDGTRVLTSHPANAKLWNVVTGNQERMFDRPSASFKKLAFTPDGKFAFAANDKQKFVCWDAATGKIVRTLNRPASDSAVLAPNGRWVLSGDWGGGISLLDFETGKEVRKMGSYQHGGSSRGVAVSPDSHFALSGGTDGHVRLFDLNAGNQVAIFGRHIDHVSHVAFSPDGKFAVSACADVFENGKLRAGRGHAIRVWKLPANAATAATNDAAAVKPVAQ